MVVEETWGIPIERARGFFDSQSDVQPLEDGYCFLSCRISLTTLDSGSVGKMTFPRTLLHIEGPEKEVPIIRRRFLIQFLSAGG